jgi:hypothetical protein
MLLGQAGAQDHFVTEVVLDPRTSLHRAIESSYVCFLILRGLLSTLIKGCSYS